MAKTFKIPEATIGRLSTYSRYLERLEEKGLTTVSSGEIAAGVGVNPAQVRKDLAYFGEFGTRGVGYDVKDLYNQIMRILGLTKNWNLAIVGTGNLGTALAMYKGFKTRGFHVVALFDSDPEKIGQEINGLRIEPTEKIKDVISETAAEIGVITVPASSAQETANQLVKAGVKAILNFAPILVTVPEQVELRAVDLSVNLEFLTFRLSNR